MTALGRPIPYIGITDFETPGQVQQMLDLFEKISADKQKRLFMVGIMMSYKTLNGLETKWSKVWPTNEQIGNFFLQNPFVFNTLHYADFADQTTIDDLMNALRYADSNRTLHCIQYDMPWPRYDMVAQARDFFNSQRGRSLQSVLQVGSVAIRECDNKMHQVVQTIGKYRKVVDYILLDFSGGKGIPMDVQLLLKYIREIKSKYGDDFGIATAGGLGPATMHLIDPIVSEFPDISIDAQGKLHIDNDSLKPTDPKKQKAYLHAAMKMFP